MKQELKIHRAGGVIVNPWNIIKNGYIATVNNTIIDISSGNPIKNSRQFCPSLSSCKVNIIDHGSGILMPALVNAHAHFELSALKDKISFDLEFSGWVRELIRQRELCGIKLLREEARKAIATAIQTGTFFASEISTLGITHDIFANSDIYGLWFQEYLGESTPLSTPLSTMPSIPISIPQSASFSIPLSSSLSKSEEIFALHSEKIGGQLNNMKDIELKKSSIAGHAPHTTSPKMLRLLKQQTNAANLPFSIHVAESDDETEFIATGRGSWADFLKERGVDYSSWQSSYTELASSLYSAKPLIARSPVQHLYNLELLDSMTLAVHLLNIDIEDIEIIVKTQVKPVLCPRSNLNLHKKLPNIPLFLKYGLKPSLGTDSLASTETLNMFDEMKFVSKQFPQINPSVILEMATINGAIALGFGDMAGSIEIGKKACFIYVPINLLRNNLQDIIMNIIEYKSTNEQKTTINR